MKSKTLLLAILIVLIANMAQPIITYAQNITGSIGNWQEYSLAICSNGNVMAWGDNYYGQLGTGNNTSSNIPIQISGISSVIGVVACTTSVCALKNDGTVWTWGYNNYGQLGDGSNTMSNIPVPVSSLAGITAIVGGLYHILALKNDGTVWAWGDNTSGQLGNGSYAHSNIPVQVNSLTGIIAIIAGRGNGDYSLALKNDGTVWAWGNNYYGQLGNGNNTASNVPVQVNSLTGITAIEVVANYSLALKNDGTVWAWGDNTSGQLGNGNNTAINVPVQVNLLTGITAIEGGSSSSFAIKNDGTVWAWGNNYFGQLGNGNNIDSNIPVQVNSLTGITAISGGYLALKNDGTVWAWGENYYGQLGNGNNTNINVPEQLDSLTDITAISGNGSYSFAIKNDGIARAWGANGWGQLGNGTNTNSNVPVLINGLCQIALPNCIAHYTTSYDTLLNNFTLTVDSAITALAVAYHWDFGDGTTSTLATPSHIYTVDSLYNVCMKIYTNAGDSCTYCHVIGKDNSGNVIRNAGFTINVHNSVVTSITQNLSGEGKIEVYPNPFTNQTTILFNEAQKNTSIKIMDMLGKGIRTINFTGKQLIIEKGEMQKGIYFVQIVDTNKNVVNKKIVVQ